MRILVALACVLIAASVLSFVWAGGSNVEPRIQRAIITGRVSGDGMPDRPWAGASVQLGPDRQVLGEDGRFQFAVMPGAYTLTVCCSLRFQGIDRQLVVDGQDMELDLSLTPLRRVAGLLTIERGVEPPRGFQIAAAREGSNVVDRATTNAEGAFAFHLSEGKWSLSIDNLPEGYRIESMTLDGARIRDSVFEVRNNAEAATIADSNGALALRIDLR